jgi:thiol-disulfide isomerase/thioredoxin
MAMSQAVRWATAFCLLLAGCDSAAKTDASEAAPKAAKAKADAEVGYDIRRLRPRDGETLDAMFARMAKQTHDDGKQVAVLFSADWCEPCRHLELELGNVHPASRIGGFRILELKEEDWMSASRMNEFNTLRKRWYPKTDSYPVFVLLDAQEQKLEEMKEAIERLEAAGIEPTVSNWFADVAS